MAEILIDAHWLQLGFSTEVQFLNGFPYLETLLFRVPKGAKTDAGTLTWVLEGISDQDCS